MLMDCLAEGRSVSLPAMSVAATKQVLGSIGSYARVRKQFKVSCILGCCYVSYNVLQKLLNSLFLSFHRIL